MTLEAVLLEDGGRILCGFVRTVEVANKDGERKRATEQELSIMGSFHQVVVLFYVAGSTDVHAT
jgi:hypothetical protein